MRLRALALLSLSSILFACSSESAWRSSDALDAWTLESYRTRSRLVN